MDSAAARIVNWFETLEPATLGTIASVYTRDASFKDPFNEVRGVDAIRRIYAHMFESLTSPRFIVHAVVGEGAHLFLTWSFMFERRDGSMTIRGATELMLADDGRIRSHRDYWDAAEELYARLPLLGALMRWLRRRLAAPTS